MDSIFGIGPAEFVFILIFALIFLGPERLPKVTRDTLRFLRKLQSLTNDITQQINEELGDLQDLDPRSYIEDLMGDLEKEDAAEKKRPQKASPRAVQREKKPADSKASQPQSAPTTASRKEPEADASVQSELDAQGPTVEADGSGSSKPMPGMRPEQPSQDEQISPASAYFAENRNRTQAQAHEDADAAGDGAAGAPGENSTPDASGVEPATTETPVTETPLPEIEVNRIAPPGLAPVDSSAQAVAETASTRSVGEETEA